MSVPRLELDRIVLRAPEERDGTPLMRFLVDPTNTKFLPPVDHRDLTPERMKESLDRGLALWDAQGFGIWEIEEKPSGRWVGYCGLKWLPDRSNVELLYGVDHAFWNKGYVTEAARAALRYGFEHTKLDRICAIAIPENRASTRVMEKCGMTYQGIERHYGMKVAYYLITRDEWAKTN